MDHHDAAARRRSLLLAHASEFGDVAVKNIQLEFPNYSAHLMREPGDFPERPRALHPAFYGSFDWHSCVEMHWLLVRLLRTVPSALPAETEIRAALERNLTERNLLVEVETFRGGVHPARPYSWGWALTLAHELDTWDGDEGGRRWSAAMKPLATARSPTCTD
jgi:hypothetical protein